MGDWPASDLWRVSFLDVTSTTPCAGCGVVLDADDRAYGHMDKLWHSGCWPKTTAYDARAQSRRDVAPGPGAVSGVAEKAGQ